jgi:hypothetical protein
MRAQALHRANFDAQRASKAQLTATATQQTHSTAHANRAQSHSIRNVRFEALQVPESGLPTHYACARRRLSCRTARGFLIGLQDATGCRHRHEITLIRHMHTPISILCHLFCIGCPGLGLHLLLVLLVLVKLRPEHRLEGATTGSPPRHCTLGQRTGIFVEMTLTLLEALLPLLLLFATDFLGRGIERHANGLHPEPTLGTRAL